MNNNTNISERTGYAAKKLVTDVLFIALAFVETMFINIRLPDSSGECSAFSGRYHLWKKGQVCWLVHLIWDCLA